MFVKIVKVLSFTKISVMCCKNNDQPERSLSYSSLRKTDTSVLQQKQPPTQLLLSTTMVLAGHSVSQNTIATLY